MDEENDSHSIQHGGRFEMKGRRPSHLRARRRTMWWTLPFILLFTLLALFMFLVFQRQVHPDTEGAPAGGEVPPGEPGIKAGAEKGGSNVEEPEMQDSVWRRVSGSEVQSEELDDAGKEEGGDVLVVRGAADLAVVYAVEEEDRRQAQEREAKRRKTKEINGKRGSRNGKEDAWRQLRDAEEARDADLSDDGVLGVYRHCRGESELPDEKRKESLSVYYCQERPHQDLWIGCVLHAWHLQYALRPKIPPIQVIAAPESSSWGMSLFTLAFPGVKFVASSDKAQECVLTDQNSLQLWWPEDGATPTFYGLESLVSLKNQLYSQIGRPKHLRLPEQVTLLTGKHSVIDNAEEVARLLAQESKMQVVVVDPDSFSVEEMVRLMSNTGILVGVHGPALANVLFLPLGAAVIELFSDRYYDTMYSLVGGVSVFSYHDPGVTSLSMESRDLKVTNRVQVHLGSLRTEMQKAVRALRDNNQLYYQRSQASLE